MGLRVLPKVCYTADENKKLQQIQTLLRAIDALRQQIDVLNTHRCPISGEMYAVESVIDALTMLRFKEGE